MVVGADVEEGVVLAVVPADKDIYRFFRDFRSFWSFWSSRGFQGYRGCLPVLKLGHEPAARDDGVGFQELKGRTGVHLRRDDALQIFLDGNIVDGPGLVAVGDKAQRAFEALLFLLLPVELLADGDALEGEVVSVLFVVDFLGLHDAHADLRFGPFAAFAQDVAGFAGGEAVEVLTSRGNQ